MLELLQGSEFNVYYNIPDGIILIILLYFYDNMKFNGQYHGDNLQFINDTTIKKINNDIVSCCIFGETISNDICNKFSLYIKWKKCCAPFAFGYINSTIKESIKDWNYLLGSGVNKQHGTAIIVRKSQTLRVCDKDGYRELDNKTRTVCKEGDIFTLSFDFINNKSIIYHNGIEIDKLSFKKEEKLTPAFVFDPKGDEIEITKWNFEY